MFTAGKWHDTPPQDWKWLLQCEALAITTRKIYVERVTVGESETLLERGTRGARVGSRYIFMNVSRVNWLQGLYPKAHMAGLVTVSETIARKRESTR